MEGVVWSIAGRRGVANNEESPFHRVGVAMAISAHCPHCLKPYKFKDELAGKRVRCAAADCRQVFEVEPLPKVDAEAQALAALAELPDPAVADGPVEIRKIKVTCAACDHAWEEAWDKQGKNVLCPECRHRQKVPEQKGASTKVDWRDSKGGRPSLAKQDEVPDDVWGSSKSNVSVQSLKHAGAIPEVEVEPRSVSFWVKSGLGAALLVLVLGGGGWYFLLHGRDAGAQDQLMKEAAEGVNRLKEAGLAPATTATAEGVLRVYDAEFQARTNKTERLKTAVNEFTSTMSTIDNAPKGIERDEALTEWLVAVCALGGDEAQVKGQVKIGWEPLGTQGRAQIGGKTHVVVEELQAGIAALLKSADFETRLSAFRRLTATLAGCKQTKLLPALLGQGFVGDELIDVQGFLGLDLLRLGEDAAAKEIATELDTSIADGDKGKAPGSVRALWNVTQVKPLATIPPGSVELQTRLALSLAKAAEKNGDAAAAEAMRPGAVSDQFVALSRSAESLDDPAAVVTPAWELFKNVRNNRDEFGRVSVATWARFARAAAKAGNEDAAKGFAAAPLNDEGRAYALAEMVRGKLAAVGSQKVDVNAFDFPDDPKKVRLGHLIARAAIARHNGKATGDAALAKSFDSWPKETARPFGLAGLALGLQDKSQ
jgi:hypothetical protein